MVSIHYRSSKHSASDNSNSSELTTSLSSSRGPLSRFDSTHASSITNPCCFLKVWMAALVVVAVGVYGWIYSPRDAMINTSNNNNANSKSLNGEYGLRTKKATTSAMSSSSAPHGDNMVDDDGLGPFSLLVHLQFQTNEARIQFLKDIAPLAKYVHDSEPTTTSYQVLQSDQDSLSLLVLERYTDKAKSYLHIHKSAQPFVEFRQKLQGMQEARWQRLKRNVTVSGHSYRDRTDDLGFFQRPGQTSVVPGAKKKVFTLIVTLVFVDKASLKEFVTLYRDVANHVRDHEPTTLCYHVLQSDQNPLQLLLLDRYVDKPQAYLQTHKTSPAFQTFRPQLQALQDAKKVEVTGQSFLDTNVGFVLRGNP